jgi:hypothetical protein
MPTKHFFNRLEDYYEQVGQVLRGEIKSATVFPNAADIGVTRERIYLRFLQQHLPAATHATMGGFLFGLDGSESGQLDIIVSSSSSPRFDFHANGGKSFACVDGAIAVASVKSGLGKRDLHDALQNIASIPDKAPLAGRAMPLLNLPNYDDWPFKIIFACDGPEIPTTLHNIQEFADSHQDLPVNKLPNVIHVAGKHLITRIGPNGATTRDGTHLPPNKFYAVADATDTYALAWVTKEIQARAATAGFVHHDYAALVDGLPMRQYKANPRLVDPVLETAKDGSG